MSKPTKDVLPIDVAMRRTAKCGDTTLPVGHLLGSVLLPPGVSLNYFVDAVRNGFAGEVKPPSEAPKPEPEKPADVTKGTPQKP